MTEKRFYLPVGVRSDAIGFFEEEVIVVRKELDPKAVLVRVLVDKIINGSGSVPGDLRINPGNFREYDDYNPGFGSVTDFFVAAEEFSRDKLGLELSTVLEDLERAVRLAANERESRYKKDFEEVRASGELLGNLPIDIERAAADLTRMYGSVLVLRDYVESKLEATPRGERMAPMPYTSRLSKEPTAYEASVQRRLDEIRGVIRERLGSA